MRKIKAEYGEIQCIILDDRATAELDREYNFLTDSFQKKPQL